MGGCDVMNRENAKQHGKALYALGASEDDDHLYWGRIYLLVLFILPELIVEFGNVWSRSV